MPVDFQAAQKEMTAWLREPGQMPAPAVEMRRLEIYRELIHNNIRDFVETAYPVLKSLLPAVEWDYLLKRFVAEHRAKSPYFRDISLEFRSWMEASRPEWLEARPWALELLHFEWIELAADCAEAETDTMLVSPDGDLLAGIPCLRAALWPLVYRWPVHELSLENPPAPEPPAQPTCLLVFRDDEDSVDMLAVHPLSARLVELLQAGEARSGRDLLLQLADEAAVPAEAGARESFVQSGAGLLVDLRQRGVIRGTRLLSA
ncbi:MAG: HvfC family RiPP maturation protein [Moraxellaceae bacterium]